MFRNLEEGVGMMVAAHTVRDAVGIAGGVAPWWSTVQGVARGSPSMLLLVLLPCDGFPRCGALSMLEILKCAPWSKNR